MDALCGVKRNELRRWVTRVQLDLVDCRHDGGVRVSEELLEVAHGKVGDANVADLACCEGLLHVVPRVDKVPVVIDLLLAGHEGGGPVNQPEIDVVDAELGERVVEGVVHALVVGVVELGGDPDLVARHTGRLDALADFGLVPVRGGRVDVAVAGVKGGSDGGRDLVRLGLPCAEAEGGDLGSRVEGECAATSEVVSEECQAGSQGQLR